ncbi:MAG: glycosyl hydrolase family protein [Bacteroidetes bacterium]|nr:MAG: glycosyl hydrolase family protein [Bacteroidota bacterium]
MKTLMSTLPKPFWLVLLSVTISTSLLPAQPSLFDDFEGNGTITTWAADGCGLNTSLPNPVSGGLNPSATVLEYHDTGGQYANIRFDAPANFDLSVHHSFALKVYVPASGLTGAAPNQVSLKLQDGTLAEPWLSQTEIIKPIVLDQWQTLTFDFGSDPYINFDVNSPPPVQRTDFNRVLIQVNGENNHDHVLAYIDDVAYLDTATADPGFDYLVWADEFDGTGAIDGSKWWHQTQLPNGDSWWGGELQHYTDRTDNAYVEDGRLHIVAKKEPFTDQSVTKQYTSARLNSKLAFTHGRVEVRAKLPTGSGTLPAIWMLGRNINEIGAYWQTQGFGEVLWPECGEIDIMEHWGANPNYISSATHSPSSFGNTVNVGGQAVLTATTAFHVYSLEWTEERLVFAVDDNVHFTYQPPVRDSATWPFDAPMYLLLNTAILPSIDPAFTENVMEIDYVRLYQRTPATSLGDPLLPSLQAYPNPVHDWLHLSVPALGLPSLSLNVYDLAGRQLWSGEYPVREGEVRLPVGELPSGMYLLQWQQAGARQTLRFVKE